VAKGFWRGQAAQKNIFDAWMKDYLGGMPGGLEQILGGMYEAYTPYLEDIMGQYYHTTAALGQAVPGQGMSGAALGGMQDIFADVGSQMLGQALGAYTQPWQSMFGSAGGMGQQYMGTKGGPGVGGFLGQLLGMGVGGLASGLGGGLGYGMAGNMMGGGLPPINPNINPAGDVLPYMFGK
jgi:hypothetical protein